MFESGRFTSPFEADGTAEPALIERFGRFSLHYELVVGANDIIWKLRRARLFGIPLPTALAPRVTAREWVTESGQYEMSAQVTAPVVGHLLSYTGTLTRMSA